MINNYEKAKDILKKYNQEDLMYFYDELNDDEKEKLINQILSLNFEKILNLYKNSYILKQYEEHTGKVSPIEHFEKSRLSKDEIAKYESFGDKIIAKNQVAVVTMAGGQGSRLGFKGPKGTYELKIDGISISLYEILCNDLKRINEKYGITLNWYIMTSTANNLATKEYFKEHHYFNYPKQKIKFFTQTNLPLIKVDGKLFLQEPYLIKEASNGNGDVFKSLERYGLINDMKKNKIKYVSFGGVDNILLKNVDPLLLGMMAYNRQEIASKSVFKKDPLEKTAVYCLKDNKPAILDYDDITPELSVKKFRDGRYCYRDANMVSHIMTLDAVKKSTKFELPYHRAYKKNAFVNEEGMKQVPDEPNTFKFESFIFDSFYYFKDMLLLRVDEDEEFAPIKAFTGLYNPDIAIEKYKKHAIDFSAKIW